MAKTSVLLLMILLLYGQTSMNILCQDLSSEAPSSNTFSSPDTSSDIPDTFSTPADSTPTDLTLDNASPTKSSGVKSKIVVGAAVTLAAVGVIVIIIIVICCVCKNKPEAKPNVENAMVTNVAMKGDMQQNQNFSHTPPPKMAPSSTMSNKDDFMAAESLQYELTTLQAATNNFSMDNKIGRGGFGIVYKVTSVDLVQMPCFLNCLV
ncbi:hypothetical protein KSS87_015248 [Heliosperma pusillum]|nr:hypothetical protein KSS87_015248 [Heliosperma pusillum]